MIIGADVITLVVGFLHGSNRPTPTDDGMCFEQFHRTIGVHLGRDDRTEIVLEVDGVDGCLGAICIVTNLQLPRKLLVFMAVPMKTNPNTDVL